MARSKGQKSFFSAHSPLNRSPSNIEGDRMRKTFMSATLGALALAAAVTAGCQDNPESVRKVDQSVLPASIKSMFSQDSQITEVEEVMYSKGARQYRIHYTTADGKNKILHASDATETTPTSVFGHAIH